MTTAKPTSSPAPDASGHEKAAVRQSLLQKSAKYHLKTAAQKSYNADTGGNQGRLHGVRDGPAEQHLDADSGHFLSPQEWVSFHQ